MSDKSKEDREAEADRLLISAMPTSIGLAFGMFHEMYTGLKEAGFRERQALWIIGYGMFGGSSRLGEDEDE